MKYYVVSDVHGFYDEFRIALATQGYFSDTEPHKLILCGDIYDRGKQVAELQNFILDLMEKDEVILIRGNHEDLMLDLLDEWDMCSYKDDINISNGTVCTALQLTDFTLLDLKANPDEIKTKLSQDLFITKIIPNMVDYYETENYIFVHGWIPCTPIVYARQKGRFVYKYIYNENWREADETEWDKARWINGMEAAHCGVTEPNKTIVCGHWHCSFGHSNYEGNGGEFDNDSDFSPYFADGIIAIDACTAFSDRVNCIVIED